MKPKKETGFLSCEQGLLSLEASIVVTIFIFLVLFLQSFFVIFEARNEMAHVTLATCNSLALDVYENEQLTHSSATMDFFLALNGIGRTLHSDSFVDDSLWHKVAKGSGPAGIWNGTIYATEAGKTDAEAKASGNALKKLGGAYAETRTFTLPDGSARGLVLCKKISQTPTVYPRNGGKIAKKPL